MSTVHQSIIPYLPTPTLMGVHADEARANPTRFCGNVERCLKNPKRVRCPNFMVNDNVNGKTASLSLSNEPGSNLTALYCHKLSNP